MRSSTHRGTVHLREKQNQRGPRTPYKDPSSDDDEESHEVIKSKYQGELGSEWGAEVALHLRAAGPISALLSAYSLFCCYLGQQYKASYFCFC